MPSVDDHKLKAAENEAFVRDLNRHAAIHCDWMVTGLFYSALHHVSALLHNKGCRDADLRRHAQRQELLRSKLPAETQLYHDYRHLKDDSEDARYECRAFTTAEVQSLQRTEFARLKAKVLALLP